MADIVPNLPLNKRRLELQLMEARTSIIRQDVKIMELRDEIAKLGWVVQDTAQGPKLRRQG